VEACNFIPEVEPNMDKPIREKSKEELRALLEYLKRAKEHVADTLKNTEKMYKRIIEKYDKVKEEIEGREDGQK